MRIKFTNDNILEMSELGVMAFIHTKSDVEPICDLLYILIDITVVPLM